MRKILFFITICLFVMSLSSNLVGQTRRGRPSRSRSGTTKNPPASLTLEDQARMFAQEWLNARYKKCSEYYDMAFTSTGHTSLWWPQITSPPSITVTGHYVSPIALSEADRLNGVDPQPIEWQGEINLTLGTYRGKTFSMGKMVWMQWQSNWKNRYPIYKQKGVWHIGQQEPLPIPFKCSDIPANERDRSTSAVSISNITSSDDKRVAWLNIRTGQKVPSNAITGGVELGGENNGVSLYICRAPYNDGVHPGKLINGYCNIGYGGDEVVISEYQVATGSGFWGRPKSGYAGALIGGRESERVLYICRANFRENGVSGIRDHGQHPGKIVDGKCHFGFGGRELVSDDFEVFYPNPQ